jgi:TRAP-type mannitol/chloroaromatic compound transport system permease small subunit
VVNYNAFGEGSFELFFLFPFVTVFIFVSLYVFYMKMKNGS